MDIARTRTLLHQFNFQALFIEELGWSLPPSRQPVTWEIDGLVCTRRQMAELGGALVFEVTTAQGNIPPAKMRAAIYKNISQQYLENLIIFLDEPRSQSLWYWVKREGAKRYPREHHYMQGQPGDLLLSKLSGMFVDMSELADDGSFGIVEAARRLQQALDIEPVTKKFYTEFREEHLDFLEQIEGIGDERDRRWYTSVLLNRLMFIYFLQSRGFLDRGNYRYLQDKLIESKGRGPDRFYQEFLQALFFEGFGKPVEQRSASAKKLIGDIWYLNGGLFLRHTIENRPDYAHISIPDAAFDRLLALFEDYSWNLDDSPGGQDDEINPDVLGYIFEKYINQKAFGAYYTRTEITEYLCEQTIFKIILDQVNTPPGTPAVPGLKRYRFDSIPELLINLDAPLCKQLLDILPKISLLDPACGSGAFLVAAMKTLIQLYTGVTGKIPYLKDPALTHWLAEAQANHPNLGYFIKKKIITENLFGVDIMEEATEIARLRLFLALVASARSVADLEPLPNIDFNILPGNALIGLLRVDEARYNRQLNMFQKPYHEVVAEKNRLIRAYKSAATYTDDLQALRDTIQTHRAEAMSHLNDLLLDDFKALSIKFSQATWDAKTKRESKPQTRALTIEDMAALHPFHWGYEFDEILNERDGFDAIITNPPWEIFKPNAKEFFAEYSGLVTKNKMTIREFEQEQTKLLQNPEIRAAWLEYQRRYPHVSLFFRSAPQFINQISMVNGKKAGTDINLYKLFLEQCYNLLRPKGQCGIVIPSGIYTDLGTKQLRELLFDQTQVQGLFCVENRRAVFEGVDSRFKFVVLTFAKNGQTQTFPAAFMRHEVAELAQFPKEGSINISIPLIRRLSPDSLSVMEFKSETDVQIAEKMLRFPLLGEAIANTWNLKLTNEFHMTNDSYLFKTSSGRGRLPLYEGKMIHQFEHQFAEPRYWVNEREGRAAIIGRDKDFGQKLDYQCYRLGFRDIARNTDTRTLIATIIPPAFHGNKIPTVKVLDENSNPILRDVEQLFLAAVWNSFVIDAILRMKVTTTINFFYIYQLPVPRLTEKDPAFWPIVERAARLICTTPEFDDLAKEVGLGSHKRGVTNPVERGRLRAELDGLIAHLYGLTEAEFAHILSVFPLVAEPVKVAAQNAYRDVERGLIK